MHREQKLASTRRSSPSPGMKLTRPWGTRSVIQRQTNTERPLRGDEDELQTEQPVAELGGSQEGDDRGQGVASIEAGLPLQSEPEEQTNNAVQASGRLIARSSPMRMSPVQDLQNPVSLPLSERIPMERHFGQSFQHVRIHADTRANDVAESLGAYAFTYGNHIVFAAGRFRPNTLFGRRLLAHELTHVVQQRAGLDQDTIGRGLGATGDRYEREADHSADRLISGLQKAGVPHTALPNASLAHRQLAPSNTSIGAAIQTYSGTAAASYATKWWSSTNSTYGRFSNDCTNFVSQALLAGGWKMATGSSYCGNRKSNDVWWFKQDGCDRTWPIPNVNASHTWGGAQNFYQFVKASGRGSRAKSVSDLNVGDVLQADWDNNGNISHTMIVTKSTPTNTYLTYHTSDHLDEPFWADGRNTGILGRNPTASKGGKSVYYGWKM